MTNPDLVPQGSIPQVLALRELLAEVWRAHRDPGDPEFNDCDAAPCQWCTETQQHIESLLTALRSLPPVPMQQVLESLIAQWRTKAAAYGHYHQLAAQHHVNQCADDLAAALRSLASQQQETTKGDK